MINKVNYSTMYNNGCILVKVCHTLYIFPWNVILLFYDFPLNFLPRLIEIFKISGYLPLWNTLIISSTSNGATIWLTMFKFLLLLHNKLLSLYSFLQKLPLFLFYLHTLGKYFGDNTLNRIYIRIIYFRVYNVNVLLTYTNKITSNI